MKLNNVPNLRTEDFPEESKWIGGLFIQLNPFIQNISQIFNNGIDYSTNIMTLTSMFDVNPFQAFNFNWPFPNNPPVSVEVVQAAKGNALTPTILMCSWSYNVSGSTISVSKMVELATTGVSALSGRYKFTIRASI